MNQFKLVAVVIILILSTITCFSESPEQTFELMRQEACNGNVEGFFSYVEKKAIARNHNARTLNLKYETLEALDNEGLGFTKDTEEFLDLLIWDPIKSNIPKGKDGALCSFEIVNIDKEANEVTVTADGEVEYIWEFKKKEDSWKLISLNFDDFYKKSRSDIEQNKSKHKTDEPRTKKKDRNEAKNKAQPDKFNYRETYWGMTQKEVKATEKLNPIYESGSSLVYEYQVEGIKASIWYYFNNNKLWSVIIRIEEHYSDYTKYIDDFNMLKDNLAKKYGQANSYSETWKDEKYKHKPELYGKALMEGDLSYSASWYQSNNILRINLSEFKKRVTLQLSYNYVGDM